MTQPTIDDAAAALLAELGRMHLGNWALSAGGSTSKGVADHLSDLDLRLYVEDGIPRPDAGDPFWDDYNAAEQSWRDRGLRIDHIGMRTFASVERELDRILGGDYTHPAPVWTIWTYRLLPDAFNQTIYYDNTGRLTAWKERLKTYSPVLKHAILRRFVPSLTYWRQDYHYRNKVARRDVTFLVGLASRLGHEMLEILFAVNEVYYPGDGNNLKLAAKLPVKPELFVERLAAALCPVPGDDMFDRQYQTIAGLIDDVLAVAEPVLDGQGAAARE
jgi:hypothetical protein